MLTFLLTEFPVLASERLVLRELRSTDAEELFALRSDPLVMQHVNRPMAVTIADAETLIAMINTRMAEKEAIHWVITLKGDDRFIGLIGFWRLVKEHHYAELGYTLARAHWGQGYISEAIATVVDFGFHSLDFHRVEATTRPQNIASVRALEKNGFVLEGRFKENIFWNGSFHDSLQFARLST